MSILRSILTDVDEGSFDGRTVSLDAFNCTEELVEVSEQYHEIVSLEEAIDRLEEIHASLESFLEITEDSLEEGGLDATTSQILRISTEALVSPLGLESPILSMESFGSDGERLSSTRVSIEEEKGTIAKIWEAIKKSMASLRTKVSNWYYNVIKNAKSISEKNTAFRKTIDEITGDAGDKKLKVNLSNLASKGQSASDIVNNLSNTQDCLEAFTSGAVSGLIGKAIDEFKKVDAKGLTDESAKGFKESVKGVLEDYTKLSSKTKDSGTVKSMEMSGATVTKHKVMAGNKALFSYMFESDPFKNDWKVGPNADGDNAGSEELSVLSKSELLAINSSVQSLIDEVVKYKSEFEKVKKVKEDIGKVGDDFVKEAKGSDGAKHAKGVVTVLKSFERMLNNPVNALTALAVKSSGAAMSLVSDMTKAYK